jgi:hypothetical protein
MFDTFYTTWVIIIVLDNRNLAQTRSRHAHIGCEKHDNWTTVEEYISNQLGSDSTHTVCPSCREKLYLEIGN